MIKFLAFFLGKKIEYGCHLAQLTLCSLRLALIRGCARRNPVAFVFRSSSFPLLTRISSDPISL